MYIFVIENTGKYDNVAIGARVCFSLKHTLEFCNLLCEDEVEFKLYKLGDRCNGLFFTTKRIR